jgi:hypothetical protein
MHTIPSFLDTVFHNWYHNEVHYVEDIGSHREELENSAKQFYCCNCHKHLHIKFKQEIAERRQHRCIDCHKIISKLIKRISRERINYEQR